MELISGLQQIGLPGREAEVYVALLQKNEFTASELTKITNVTRTKIYEILQNLIHKGMCSESYKDGQKVFRGVKPKLAIQNILSSFQKELEQKKQAGYALEKELISIHESGMNNVDPLDYIEVLKDKNQIKNRWIELQKNTAVEMLGFNKPPYSMPHGENTPHQERMMKKKKVKSKGIYEAEDIYSGSSPTDFMKVVEFYSKQGEDCRVINSLPMKMMLMDEKITMIALNDPVSMQPSITTMIVNHPSFAFSLKRVFEIYWANAVPLEDFKKLNKL